MKLCDLMDKLADYIFLFIDTDHENIGCKTVREWEQEPYYSKVLSQASVDYIDLTCYGERFSVHITLP